MSRSMTLMPVSNMIRFGSRVSKSGAGRWISQWSSMLSSFGTSSGSPSTLITWPSTPSPTGIAKPRPRFRTAVPRVSPSVGFMQIARMRPSPICCATSAVITTSLPSIVTVNSMAWLISGR